jgi:hypothetical protein
MKLKITEVREVLYEVNLNHYEEGITPEGVVEVERQNYEENPDYMDMFDYIPGAGCKYDVSFEIVGG